MAAITKMTAEIINVVRICFFPKGMLVSNIRPIIKENIPVIDGNRNSGDFNKTSINILKVPTLIAIAITPMFPAATTKLMKAANFLFLVSFMFFLSHNVVALDLTGGFIACSWSKRLVGCSLSF